MITPEQNPSLVWIKNVKISRFHRPLSTGPPKWVYKMSISENPILHCHYISLKF